MPARDTTCLIGPQSSGAGGQQVRERHEQDEQEDAHHDEPVRAGDELRKTVVNGYRKMISTSSTMNAIATR